MLAWWASYATPNIFSELNADSLPTESSYTITSSLVGRTTADTNAIVLKERSGIIDIGTGHKIINTAAPVAVSSELGGRWTGPWTGW